MSHNLDKPLPFRRGSCSFQIVSNMWLIQDGVMLSIMPGVRHEGQLRGGAIPTVGLFRVLANASFLHLSVEFLPLNGSSATHLT